MDQGALTLSSTPTPRRRGRPPGAKSKRSLDLARYVEATFAGATPGQQSAQLCLVTPRELREARSAAKELRIPDLGLDPTTLAMVVKAKRLASAIGCDTAVAWGLLAREREGLMSYIHPKTSPAPPVKAGALHQVFVIPEGQESASPALDLGDGESIEILEDLSGAGGQVGQPKSDGDR